MTSIAIFNRQEMIGCYKKFCMPSSLPYTTETDNSHPFKGLRTVPSSFGNKESFFLFVFFTKITASPEFLSLSRSNNGGVEGDSVIVRNSKALDDETSRNIKKRAQRT